MRSARAAALDGRTAAQAQPTREDLDVALEERFTYEGREPELSTLAFVSAYRARLAADFVTWRSTGRGPSVGEDLGVFEVERFGARLEFAAHGILLFEVMVLMHRDCGDGCRCRGRYRGRIAPRRAPRPAGDLARFDAAVGRLARESGMPATRLSGRERDDRHQHLQRQVDEVEASS